jgi:hypothetical protein
MLASSAMASEVTTSGGDCSPVTIVTRTCTCIEDSQVSQYLYIPTLQILKSDGNFTSANLGSDLYSQDCQNVISQSPICKQ